MLDNDAMMNFRDTSIIVKSIEEISSLFIYHFENIHNTLIWSLDEIISSEDNELFKCVAEKNYTNKQKIDSFMMSVSFEKDFSWWWNNDNDDVSQ